MNDELDLTLLSRFSSIDSLAQRLHVTRELIQARCTEVARAIHLGWLETRRHPDMLYLSRAGHERRREAQLQINIRAMKRDQKRRG